MGWCSNVAFLSFYHFYRRKQASKQAQTPRARARARGATDRPRARPVRRRRRVALVATQQSLDVAEATVADALLLRRVWQPEMERTVSPFAFAKRPDGNSCSYRDGGTNWSIPKCCSSSFARRVDLHKWTQLDGSGVAIFEPRPFSVGHVHLVEPLSVAAFVAAIYD